MRLNRTAMLASGVGLSLGTLVLAGCSGNAQENGSGDPESSGQKPADPPTLMPGIELASLEQTNTQTQPTVIDLNVEQLQPLVASGHLRLIDVRTAEEVADGIIPGARHIPLDGFDPALLDPRSIQNVVLYCRSGRRSAAAAQKLSAFTGKPALHLAGGILEWQAAGHTIE